MSKRVKTHLIREESIERGRRVDSRHPNLASAQRRLERLQFRAVFGVLGTSFGTKFNIEEIQK